ncbi:hypothetical protein ACQ858_08175 [Variovorax ureilyticus]
MRALLFTLLLASCGGGGDAYVTHTEEAPKCAPALAKPGGGSPACTQEQQ